MANDVTRETFACYIAKAENGWCKIPRRVANDILLRIDNDAERLRALDRRIAELEARAEKAEAKRHQFESFAADWHAALMTAATIVGAGSAGSPEEIIADIRAAFDAERAGRLTAETLLARLRAAGAFNEGIEAGVVAGWNACRRSVYAVCEDIGTEADRNRSDTENPPRHHFGRGECDAVKRIARAFNSMEALDDDNATAALRSLRRPENEVT